MKIHRLRFKNINSLRGEHEIDFTQPPLAGSGLFAITGPTGSGKSTLLDVITLALFNRVPRLGKSISKNFVAQSGALLTRNTQDAYASVDYECHTGVFRSTWSISVNRNGNLRDYEMEVVNLEQNQHLDLKKGEVPSENERFIGLNYDQFVKSIMLAQGEFAQFLKVDKSARGELLEKITGTGIYRELGHKAFEKKQRFAKELERLHERRSVYTEALLGAEELQAQTHSQKSLDAQVKKLGAEVVKLEDEQKLRRELQDLQAKKESLSDTLKSYENALKEFEEGYSQKLQRHEATADFASELDEWKSRNSKISELKEELVNLAKQHERKEDSLKELRAQVKDFLQSEPADEEVSEKLEAFRQKVEKLDQKLSGFRDAYKGQMAQLRSIGDSWGYEPQFKDALAESDKLRELQAETEEQLSDLSVRWPKLALQDSEERVQQLQQEYVSAQQGKHWDEALQKLRGNLKSENQSLSKQKEQLKSLPAKLENLKLRQKTKEAESKSLRLELENQKLRASLEEHRAHLEDGKPCPLCGAEHHPWAEHDPQVKGGLEQREQELEKELREATQNLHKAESELGTAQKAVKESEERIIKLQEEEQDLLSNLKNNCSQWWQEAGTNWRQVLEKIEAEQKAVRDFERLQKRSAGIAKCIPVLNEMLTQTEEGKKLRQERDRLYQGSDINADCGRLRDNWQSLKQEIEQLTAQQKERTQVLEKQKEIQQKAEKDLSPKLQEKGFETIQAALVARLPEGEYVKLSQQNSKLKSEVQSAKAELKSTQEAAAEKAKQKGELSDEELLETLSGKKVEQAESQKELEEVNRSLKNHEDNLQNISKLDEQIREEEKTGQKWKLLNDLIGDSTGKKFNDFAQDLTLQQLLVLANKRLKSLSDRYRIDKPQDEEDDSLIAIDEHMGGQRRSVKTLSGGETFVLSLSLALALSDLASKNVTINSLFIDEGFGTLDPETLDTTLDTLERLQAESSKTIGIISHVEALKERISTQIQLVRNGQGFSSLKLV